MNGRTGGRWGWGLAAALALVLSASVISPALGGPDVLTLGKAKKVFVTKKKAKRTYLSKQAAAATYLTQQAAATTYLDRAEGDARYLSPAEGNASYPRLAGETRAPVPPGGWIEGPNRANTSVIPSPTSAAVATSSANITDVDVYAPASAPSQLYGRPTKVVGLQLCFEVGVVNQDAPQIDEIHLTRSGGTAADPVALYPEKVRTDTTTRVEGGCPVFRFAAFQAGANDQLGVSVRIDFDQANNPLSIGSASLILRG